jgi:hypothetical protein
MDIKDERFGAGLLTATAREAALATEPTGAGLK